MSGRDNKFLDCYITPGVLAIIVVVVVVSVVIAYLIATACVRAWSGMSPTYMYCARCNQFLGSSDVGLPPHLLPGPQGPSYNFHQVPDVRVNVSEHDERPPTGTFQRLGMRTSKSNRSSTFPNFMSPIQASPPDKITSEMELLTPVPEAHLPKYVNHPGSVKISKSSTPYDSSATKRVQSPTQSQQFSRKDGPPAAGASGRSVQTVNSELLSEVEQETACVSGDDSVFYEVEEGGDCRHNREVSKMSQVRILASPPPIGASKLPGALIAKTPANANKSHRSMGSRSCHPEVSVPSKIINRIRSSLRGKDQTGRSVQSEGSGKSRRSLMSFKFNLLSEDRKPKNSKDTQYSPLINQNPTTTEDSCGMKSAISEEDQPLLSRTNAVLHEKSENTSQMNGQANDGFIQEENVLNIDPLANQNELNTDSEKISSRNKNTVSEAKKAKKRGSPGNTGNVSISHQLVDIDIDNAPASMAMEFAGDPCKVGSCSSDNDDDPALVSTKPAADPSQVRTCSSDNEGPPASGFEFRGDSCKVGECSSPKKDEKQVENGLPKDDHLIRSGTPLRQDLGTRPKVRTSSSARKEKAKYLGKRPGFTESDITSQSEDERPRSRLASLRRNHLPGMSQSEEDEETSRKERDNMLGSETPSQSPQYPVQTSTFVTTKRGPPTPSSLPVTTPKYITVRERNHSPDTSNYPPNSWDSKPEFPPNSWDPMNHEFAINKPLNLSASSGQVNVSISSCINNNLSVTAMDNSTPAEGNHTSSPHSTAHQTSFKPEDLSIPGFDSSLQLQVSPSQDGARSAYAEHIESSPPLVRKDGRYRHPLNNPMKQPVPFPGSPEFQSPQVLISNTPNSNRHETQGSNADNLESNNSPRDGSNNLASPYDIRYPKDLLGNLDNSTGSVSSQSQQLRLSHDASKGSQDTSGGVSLDSTSTLVPSPVNLIHRSTLVPSPVNLIHRSTLVPSPVNLISPNEASSAVTPVFSKSSPSPQHSLNQRPADRNHQIRSMPPVTQWSRVQEHALPPSLPPPVSKSRILDVPLSSNARLESLNSAENAYALIQGSRESDRSVPSAGTQPLDMSKETFSSAPTGPMQQSRSMPPAPQWSRVKEHAPPPSLPPPASRARIPGFGFQQETGNDARHRRMGVVPEEMDLPVPDIGWQNDASALASGKLVRSDRGDSRQTRHGGPNVHTRHGDPDVQTRHGGPNVQTRYGGPDVHTRHGGPDVQTRHGGPDMHTRDGGSNVHTRYGGSDVHTQHGGPDVQTQDRGSDVQTRDWGSDVHTRHGGPDVQTRHGGPDVQTWHEGPDVQTWHEGPDVQTQHGGPDVHTRHGGPDVNTRHRGPDVQTRHGGPDVPGRTRIPQSNRSQSVASHANLPVAQVRTRSTTESSQAPSLAWDSYGSDPSFVPRKKSDLEDFTLSSTSESEADNNVTVEQHVAYRSDGDQRYKRDVLSAARGQQNRPVGERNASAYFQAGVRTRSQSQ